MARVYIQTKMVTVSMYILGVTSTLAFPIEFFVGFPIYKLAAVALLILILSLLFRERWRRGGGYSNYDFSQSIILIGAFCFAGLIALYFRDAIDVLVVVSGYLLYILPLYLLTLTNYFKKEFEPNGYIKINSWLAVGIGVVSLYQLFVEPTLLGMYANTAYEGFEHWGVRRAASVMGSIQVYSCYMAFSLWAIVFTRPFDRPATNIVVAASVMLLGITGGSQTYFALVVVFSIYFIRLRYMLMMPLLLILAYLFGGFDVLIRDAGPLSRVVEMMEGGVSYIESLNSDRFDYWLAALAVTNPIWGNGLGSASVVLEGEARVNVESYFINIFYEGGLLLLAPWLVFLARHLLRYQFGNMKKSVALTFAMTFILYGITVHAYFSIFLYFVWFLFFCVHRFRFNAIIK